MLTFVLTFVSVLLGAAVACLAATWIVLGRRHVEAAESSASALNLMAAVAILNSREDALPEGVRERAIQVLDELASGYS